jgi:hypothetical protein
VKIADTLNFCKILDIDIVMNKSVYHGVSIKMVLLHCNNHGSAIIYN